MGIRFMGKNPRRKVVKQIPNNRFQRVSGILKQEKLEVQKADEIQNEEKIEENNELKENKDMADERLEKIEQIVGAKAPKRTIKREKKEKGLIERTENSTILLTEDNKMLLND